MLCRVLVSLLKLKLVLDDLAEVLVDEQFVSLEASVCDGEALAAELEACLELVF